jgi:anti-sigma B factor antagonist
MRLRIEQKQVPPDITVLELRGKITLGPDSLQLESLVKELREAQVRKLIFDMAGIEYLDSAGLGVLTYCFRTMKKVGGEFRLAAPGDSVLKLLQLTHLDSILPVDPNVGDACRQLQAAETAGG